MISSHSWCYLCPNESLQPDIYLQIFSSLRLQNASNFYSKLILNWISAWQSCSSGSLETEQDSLETEQHFSPFPQCIWGLQIQSPKPPLGACNTEALQLVLCRQSRNTWFCLPEGSWQLPYIMQQGKCQHWPTALSSFTPCFELSCCVWGCLGGCLFQQGTQVSKRNTAAPATGGYSSISRAEPC